MFEYHERKLNTTANQCWATYMKTVINYSLHISHSESNDISLLISQQQK